MKKVVFFLLMFFLLINGISALDLNSKYAYVYNLTEDKVMYEKEANEEIKVASLTKIMTAILVIENNKDLDKQVKIIDDDLRDIYEYTTTGFQNGDLVTIKELLYGILLKSGSDAVNSAVRITSGDEEQFVRLMNQKAKEIGMSHTYFSNPIGKDEGNYSSMADIALLMKYCLKNKTFKKIISTREYYIESLELNIPGPFYNSLSKYGIDCSIIEGAKTGYTTESKHSMVSFGENDGVMYIVVTSYADNYKNLLTDNVNIYNTYFNEYGYKDYNIKFNLDIENGKEKDYKVDIDTKLYLENNYDENLISYKYNGKNKITFLNKKGDRLGKIFIYYDKELIKQIDLRLNTNISFKTKAYSKVFISIIIIFIILGIIVIKKIHKKVFIRRKLPSNKNINNIKTAKKFIREENSVYKKFDILKNTVNIGLFFDTLKSVNYTLSDKSKFEHDFIDRCFEKIDFKNIDELQELYMKLKLYKKDMCNETVKYYNKLFKYCIDNYIN